ncbi:amidase [Nesterenkonia muleiensis]|uniref:amidase n=1 Tax=Nesterenkonia muleiensis TaxID=2282648 RepID=UPI000E7276E9|nr:amidase [Nesterenkonia muleiensis]
MTGAELTAVHQAEQALSALETHAELNAFCHVDAEGARRAAAESDRRRAAGTPLSAVDGVPTSIKDNLYVSGMPATWGSRKWARFVPQQDDIVVERLRAAGSVILGKTNTPEFAMSANTDNPLFGITRNPQNTELTPGGSSGGASASVAAGITEFAVGTDSGGSIRAPASLTGIYGLRPTNGAVPRAYGFPPMALDFQVIGLIAKTLATLKLYFSLLAGPDVRDPASLLVPAHLPRPQVKVALVREVNGEPVDPEALECLEEAFEMLSAAGDVLVGPGQAPYDVEEIRWLWEILTAVGSAAALRYAPTPEAELTDTVKKLSDGAAEISSAEYGDAVTQVSAVRRRISATWGDADVYMMPVIPTAAWAANAGAPATVGGEPARPGALSAFMSWVNLMGYPALSVPVRGYPDGRHFGVQLIARPGQERTLFRLAEKLLPLYPGQD